jgi:hypothetical protein
MTTATKSPKARKPARKPERSATLGTMTNGKLMLWLSEDGEVKNGYTLTAIASDIGGTAFRLGKADVGGCSEDYDVLLCGRETSCTCPGHTYRSKCKHVSALEALTAAGKLPVALVQSGKLSTESHDSVETPAHREPWCKHCGDERGVFCEHCSL